MHLSLAFHGLFERKKTHPWHSAIIVLYIMDHHLRARGAGIQPMRISDNGVVNPHARNALWLAGGQRVRGSDTFLPYNARSGFCCSLQLRVRDIVLCLLAESRFFGSSSSNVFVRIAGKVRLCMV